MGNTTSVSQTQYKYNSWEDFRKLTDKEIQDIDPIDVNPDLFDDSKYTPKPTDFSNNKLQSLKYLKNKYDNWKYQNKTVTKVGGRRRKARKIIKTRKTRRRKNKK